MRRFDVVKVVRMKDCRFDPLRDALERAPMVGDVGTILDVYGTPEQAYEIECLNLQTGRAIWVAALYPDELEVIWSPLNGLDPVPEGVIRLLLSLERSGNQSVGDWLAVIVFLLNQNIAARRFDVLNDFLVRVRAGSTPPEALVTVLRTTAAIRSLLPAWESLRARSEGAMRANRIDTKRALAGL